MILRGATLLSSILPIYRQRVAVNSGVSCHRSSVHQETHHPSMAMTTTPLAEV